MSTLTVVPAIPPFSPTALHCHQHLGRAGRACRGQDHHSLRGSCVRLAGALFPALFGWDNSGSDLPLLPCSLSIIPPLAFCLFATCKKPKILFCQPPPTRSQPQIHAHPTSPIPDQHIASHRPRICARFWSASCFHFAIHHHLITCYLLSSLSVA